MNSTDKSRPVQLPRYPQRFEQDANTVVLYRFDEGAGDECHEATDPALTLRAHKRALWGSVEGLGPVIRFERGSNDDANVLVGPIDHDALELRRCPDEYTVEAWVRYTGPWGAELGGEHPRTTAQICGTDDDGFSLPSGRRRGWSFSLHDGTREQPQDGRLMPQARNLGQAGYRDFRDLSGLEGTRGPFYCGLADAAAVSRTGIEGEGWHHVAWQWRKLDEAHWLFVDGAVVWSGRAPETRVVGPVVGNTIPFMVGGVVHSQDPPFYLGWCSFEGEMAGLRISNVLRLPVARGLRIVPTYGRVHFNERSGPSTEEQRAAARAHPASLSDATVQVPYRAAVVVEGGTAVSFSLVDDGQPAALPQGLHFDRLQGVVHGVPTVPGTTAFTVLVTATDGQQAQQPFTLSVVEGRLGTRSLPPAFGGRPYSAALDSGTLGPSVRWQSTGILPPWLSLEERDNAGFNDDGGWCIIGTPPESRCGTVERLTLEASAITGTDVDQKTLELRILAPRLRELEVDEHTQTLWDWQGDDGKMIMDRAGLAGDDSLTLSWVNMAGDTREWFPGWGRYPWECGGGEWGFATPGEAGEIADLRECTEAWCVEAWFRVGDNQIKFDRYGRTFDFGHICGTFDSSEQGVWELFLSTHDSPNGSTLAPGVTFASAGYRWESLGPWKYPQGIVAGDHGACCVFDSEWHHVAWQYEYGTDTHELWLDGRLIWSLANADGVPLVNDRVGHGAQFSVSTRPTGHCRFGGEFNFLGYGHWFGHIGDIRISDVRRLP